MSLKSTNRDLEKNGLALGFLVLQISRFGILKVAPSLSPSEPRHLGLYGSHPLNSLSENSLTPVLFKVRVGDASSRYHDECWSETLLLLSLSINDVVN